MQAGELFFWAGERNTGSRYKKTEGILWDILCFQLQ